jgi:predicted CXXCH cytochrome family protein
MGLVKTGVFALTAFSLHAAVPSSDYVDSRVCAKCHSKIDETYRRTGMGRSLSKPQFSNTIADYLHQLSDTHYSMTIRDSASYQRRWQIGVDGKETNVEELKIDYVIGSGNHAVSYLHRTATGGYIELPLGWYPEKGGYFAMSPGFDARHPATRRFASYECIFCHDAIPRIPAGHEAPGSDPVFVGDLPEGIDCQRCHGPGARHVRIAQTAGAKLDDIRTSIVNPAHLSPARRMDLCMQCHLEPTSGKLPALIRRFNRGPFSFVPGEALSNFLLVFDHAPATGHDDKFEIVGSSAYRLRQSQCFLKSNGAMTCETCHDPHNARRGAEATSHYSAVCRQCHTAAFDARVRSGSHPASQECISCHMPKRRTDDVVHVVMTDHLIQRRLPARDLLAEMPERHPAEAEEYRGEVVPYYPSPLPRTDENILYRAVAQVALGNNLQKGTLELARETARAQPREAEFYMVLGDAWQSERKPLDAVTAYEHALRLRLESSRGLVSLAAALKAAGQVSRADETLKRAIQVAPESAPAWFQSGAIDYELGRVPSAIAKMQKAITLDVDLTGGRTGLAEILWRTGNLDGAESELRQALNMDPYDAAATNLLGRVLAGKGQIPEAVFDFEKATRLRPGHAPYLYDYALVLSSVNRPEDAQAQVEAALRADPNMSEAHELLGGLFAGQRRLPEAAREYAEAVRLKPDFARAHLDLARVLAAQGEIPTAVEHLRKAAAGSDPQVAQVASQALQRLGAR